MTDKTRRLRNILRSTEATRLAADTALAPGSGRSSARAAPRRSIQEGGRKAAFTQTSHAESFRAVRRVGVQP